MLFFVDHLVHGDDRKIPLLRDLFKAYPSMPINVDIKIDNDDLIQKVSTVNTKRSLVLHYEAVKPDWGFHPDNYHMHIHT